MRLSDLIIELVEEHDAALIISGIASMIERPHEVNKELSEAEEKAVRKAFETRK